MRRFKQQISDDECKNVLKNEPRGVLALMGDDGYPYAIPLNHWYSEKDNKLYFHCAKEGKKLDSLKQSDRVSFCVMDEGYRNEGEWALNIKSVVAFGKMRIVEDEEKKKEICINLTRKFTDDKDFLEHELTNAFPRVCCLEIEIEHMTGKLVNES